MRWPRLCFPGVSPADFGETYRSETPDFLARSDGFEPPTLRFEDFSFDKEQNVYICPAGKVLSMTGKVDNDGETLNYRAKSGSLHDLLHIAERLRVRIERWHTDEVADSCRLRKAGLDNRHAVFKRLPGATT